MCKCDNRIIIFGWTIPLSKTKFDNSDSNQYLISINEYIEYIVGIKPTVKYYIKQYIFSTVYKNNKGIIIKNKPCELQ